MIGATIFAVVFFVFLIAICIGFIILQISFSMSTTGEIRSAASTSVSSSESSEKTRRCCSRSA